jgi:hypothetical protein
MAFESLSALAVIEQGFSEKHPVNPVNPVNPVIPSKKHP